MFSILDKLVSSLISLHGTFRRLLPNLISQYFIFGRRDSQSLPRSIGLITGRVLLRSDFLESSLLEENYLFR